MHSLYQFHVWASTAPDRWWPHLFFWSSDQWVLFGFLSRSIYYAILCCALLKPVSLSLFYSILMVGPLFATDFLIWLSCSLFQSELQRLTKDLQGMKSQADGLSKEYDRILDENEKLQVSESKTHLIWKNVLSSALCYAICLASSFMCNGFISVAEKIENCWGWWRRRNEKRQLNAVFTNYTNVATREPRCRILRSLPKLLGKIFRFSLEFWICHHFHFVLLTLSTEFTQLWNRYA